MELFKNEAIRCGSPFRTGGLERLSDVGEVAFDGGSPDTTTSACVRPSVTSRTGDVRQAIALVKPARQRKDIGTVQGLL